MAKRELRAVEMVRKIRDELGAKLEGKSDDEIIEFLHKAGSAARLRANARRAKKPAAKRRRS